MEQTQSKIEQLDIEVGSLIDQSGSILVSKRKEAQRKLGERSAEYFEPLLQLFYFELNEYNKKSMKANYLGEIILGLLCFSIGYYFGGNYRNVVQIIFFTLLTIRIAAGKYSNNFKIYNLTADALSKYHDIRIVGPMAEALWFDNSKGAQYAYHWHTNIEKALTSVLPLIQTEDDIELTSYQVDCLNKAVGIAKPAMNLAILRALPFVGNSKSITAVKRLFFIRLPIGENNIPKAAKACLLGLEARVAKLNVAETLLRPTSFSEDDVDSLLRPNISSSQNPPDELLRTATGEE